MQIDYLLIGVKLKAIFCRVWQETTPSKSANIEGHEIPFPSQ